MQKVKLKKQTQGGSGVIKAGTVIEVSDAEAAVLLKAGYIDPPESPKKPKKG